MDKYDLILGMMWLEKHEPWIDWRDKAIGTSRPALSGRVLVSHVPTSVRSVGTHEGCQGPEEFMGVVNGIDTSQVILAPDHATGRRTLSEMSEARGPPMAGATDRAEHQGYYPAVTADSADGGGTADTPVVAAPEGGQVVNLGPQADNLVP
ncbi:hypothetical protein PI124_g6455 [Phytophthora idaei]|nr:hypothetical protein PI124_g6455 [Phytophthora idaei]